MNKKKTLLIALPIVVVLLAAMFFLAIYIFHKTIYGDEYQMQYKELIEGGYLNANHTQYELFDFCSDIYETPLEKKFLQVCTWVD